MSVRLFVLKPGVGLVSKVFCRVYVATTVNLVDRAGMGWLVCMFLEHSLVLDLAIGNYFKLLRVNANELIPAWLSLFMTSCFSILLLGKLQNDSQVLFSSFNLFPSASPFMRPVAIATWLSSLLVRAVQQKN